jgi:hypothetical protein
MPASLHFVFCLTFENDNKLRTEFKWYRSFLSEIQLALELEAG